MIGMLTVKFKRPGLPDPTEANKNNKRKEMISTLIVTLTLLLSELKVAREKVSGAPARRSIFVPRSRSRARSRFRSLKFYFFFFVYLRDNKSK
jgi:hypothetical protein